MMRSIKDPSVLLFRNKNSPTQSINKVITHLTINTPIDYPKDELIKSLPSPKTQRQELRTIEFHLLDYVDLLDRKQNNIFDFKDVVKIYCEGFAFSEWPSIPVLSFFLLILNLNEKKEGGWAAIIQDSPYKLFNIN